MSHAEVVGVGVAAVELATTHIARQVRRALALPPVPQHADAVSERLAAAPAAGPRSAARHCPSAHAARVRKRSVGPWESTINWTRCCRSC